MRHYADNLTECQVDGLEFPLFHYKFQSEIGTATHSMIPCGGRHPLTVEFKKIVGQMLRGEECM